MMKELVTDPLTIVSRGSTYDNLPNLAFQLLDRARLLIEIAPKQHIRIVGFLHIARTAVLAALAKSSICAACLVSASCRIPPGFQLTNRF